ncbi:MAG: LemA family protein [Kiritimatiellae bacterium]|nr:LemA family protein [Kiritimatiellia bacterium]
MWIAGMIMLGAAIALRACHNRLIGRVNAVLAAFASLRCLLRKKQETLGRLSPILQRHLRGQRPLLLELTELRRRVLSATVADNDRLRLANRMAEVEGQLLAAAAQVPELRTDPDFQAARTALEAAQAQVEAAGRRLNAATDAYNRVLREFPYRIIARTMNLGPRVLLVLPPPAPVATGAGHAGAE